MSTYRLADDISTIPKPLCHNISITDSLDDVDGGISHPELFGLSLAELDEPFFRPYTAQKYQALQRLVEAASGILWVVQGSRGDQPYANMMLRVSRCLMAENKDPLFQFLDVNIAEKPEPKLLADSLLRLCIFRSWKAMPLPYEPLWTLERELFMSEGNVEIPRFKPALDLDKSYNSTRRLITKDLNLESSTVTVTTSNSSFELEEYKALAPETYSNYEVITIRVTRSTLAAVKVRKYGYLHFVIGVDIQTQRKVLALSEVLRSKVTVPKVWAIDCDVVSDQEGNLILAIACELIARYIIEKWVTTVAFLFMTQVRGWRSPSSTRLLRRAHTLPSPPRTLRPNIRAFRLFMPRLQIVVLLLVFRKE